MTTNYRMLDRVPGQRLMTVRAHDIERVEEYDPDPDLSYLDPDANPEYAAQNAERLAAYRGDTWHCIGIKARASFLIGLGEAAVIQTVESPGLWGSRAIATPAISTRCFGKRRRPCATYSRSWTSRSSTPEAAGLALAPFQLPPRPASPSRGDGSPSRRRARQRGRGPRPVGDGSPGEREAFAARR